MISGTITVSVGGAQEPDAASGGKQREPLPIEVGKNWIRATKDREVWMDFKQKKVLVGGQVCLREGLLEMFACPEGTKEHESVVAVNTEARYVHAALVATGAKPGPPVQFAPEYKPAQGTPIEVTVVWKDTQGKEHRCRAQEWVKHNATGKALEYPWVFAGSGFWIDEAAGERFYSADAGELICVSNFSTATLDLPVESSDANDSLMFSAFTEHIPPRGTRICLILTPQFEKQESPQPAATKETPESAEQSANQKDAETGQADPESKPVDSPEKAGESGPKKNGG